MKILNKKTLVDMSGAKIVRMDILAPDIAANAKAGQFISLMVSDKGERIPLTIVETDKDAGSITLIFQELGFTTKALSAKDPGDSLYALLGPLGHRTEIMKYGRVVIVGGGVGIAEVLPVAKALKACGNHITTILGARSRSFLILESELKEVSDILLIATDDGSYGTKGFTTDILEDLLKKDKYGLVYSVGPIPMMKRTSAIASIYHTPITVSLNAIMLDATGMCGCCRVTVGGKVLFSCVDGPEFDASLVDWDELMSRSKAYEIQEKHICRLGKP